MSRAGIAVIVEDDPFVSRQVKRTLEELGYTVAGIAATPEAALALVRSCSPTLITVDIALGSEKDGVELAAEFEEVCGAAIVFVTGHADQATVARVVSRRSAGFVVKPFSDAQLRASISMAEVRGREAAPTGHEGAVVQVDDAIRRLTTALSELRELGQATAPPPPVPVDPAFDTISPREWEVVRAIVRLHSVPEVAKALFISPHTVRNHLKSLYSKLDVESKLALAQRVAGRPELVHSS